MFNRLRSIFKRSYDGAGGGRRWRGHPDMPQQLSAMSAARGPLASRARYLAANNALAASAVDAWVSALVGTGIKAQSSHADESIRAALNLANESWTDDADADGLTDWYGLQSLMVRRMVIDGESFALLGTVDGQLRVRLIEAEQVDASLNRPLEGGGRIVAGVEFDAEGRRIAYHVLPERPGMPFAIVRQAVRVPANDVVHLFRPEVPGQVRGVSWFAPVLLRLADLDSWRDAQLVRQKTAAMLAGFITSLDGGVKPFDGEQSGAALIGGLEPGTLKFLDPGQDIKFSHPAGIGVEVIDFAKITEREIAVGLGLPASILTGDLSDVNYSSTLDAVRAAALDAMSKRSPVISNIKVGTDHSDPVAIRSAMADALAHRLAPAAVKLEGRATEYRGTRILDMVGELATASGDRLNVRDQDALLQRAVGAHSTSDFPLLLSDAANKALLAQYQVAAPTYRKWAARKPFVDFKDHSFLRVGDFPAFKEVHEGGVVQYGTISENAEKVRAKEFGTGIAIGRRALINDDLSALSDFSAMIATRAAVDENRQAYGVLAANGNLSDNKALFHADHKNKAASGTALDGTNVAVAVAALRGQRSLDGLVLNLSPAYLVVGPQQEVAARQLLASITATKSSDVNVWSGFAELIVDAEITDKRWYVFAAPGSAPVVVYGYVAGSEGPQVRTERDFDTQAVKVAAGLDFATGVIDFRGAYQNAGL